MKKLIGLPALAAIVLISTAAVAFDPDGVTPDIEIFHAGSGASSGTLHEIVLSFCDDNANVDVFWAPNPKNVIDDANNAFDPDNAYKSNYWMIACETTGKIPGLDANTYTMEYNKRDDGGSAVGVLPVAANTPVAFMKIDATSCSANYKTDISSGIEIHICDLYDPRDAAVVDELVPPDVGSSDLEPRMFRAPINNLVADLNNDGSLDLAPTVDVNTLNPMSAGYLGFGVVGNLTLYQAAQYEQFEPTNACNPGNVGYGDITVPGSVANSVACMPSLTKAAVQSMMMNSRLVDTLEEIFANNGGVFDAPGLDAFIDAQVGSDTKIQVCRRRNGSGTQAQHNAFYFNYPCDDAVDTAFDVRQPAGQTLIVNPNTGVVIVENGVIETTSSSDLSSCMQAYEDGANLAGTNTGLKKRAAIGLQPLTRTDSISAKYRYFKIDGVAPTLSNMVSGKYAQYYPQTIQLNPGSSLNAAENAVVDEIVAQLSNPADLGGFNKQQAFYDSTDETLAGWMAVPQNDVDRRPSDSTLAAPISRYVRVDLNGGKNNSCAFPSAFPEDNATIELAP